MPLHEFRCYDCDPKSKGKTQEVFRWPTEKLVVPDCPKCDKPMSQDFNNPVTDGIIFRPVTLEHVGPNPVTFNSRREMVDFAKKNNMELGALL